MAKLIPPQTATRYKTSEDAKWSKYHFKNTHTKTGDVELSLCGKIMRPGWYPSMETTPVSEVAASDLCQKCLGAMVAED